MTVKVLGPGCVNCRTLERRTIDALAQMHLQANVQKVTELDDFIAYGLLRTPGLVIDEKLVWQGGVPSVEKIKELIAASLPVSH